MDFIRWRPAESNREAPAQIVESVSEAAPLPPPLHNLGDDIEVCREARSGASISSSSAM